MIHGNYPGLKDSTGRHAEAGHDYRIADVQVAEWGGGAPAVWARLVAGR
jgi:hypothetical protein